MTAKSATVDSVRVLIHALDQAGDVLDQVHADDLDKPTPCHGWSVSPWSTTWWRRRRGSWR